MLLADAWGSALGGLLFAAVLLPCLGGADALQLVALLTVGVAACALAPAAMVRFAATVACVACLLTGGFAWRADLRTGAQQHLPAAAATVSEMPSGRTRPVDLERVRRLWATRELATHPADFWEPESPPAAATTNGPAQAP
jgi:hypothetical protein